jgi:hypothetical protein
VQEVPLTISHCYSYTHSTLYAQVVERLQVNGTFGSDVQRTVTVTAFEALAPDSSLEVVSDVVLLQPANSPRISTPGGA